MRSRCACTSSTEEMLRCRTRCAWCVAEKLRISSMAIASSLTEVGQPLSSVNPESREGDILGLMADRRMSDVGGTPGGLGSFLFGFAMACVGGYLLANQVSVIGSYWSIYGGSTFGITLLPLLIGVGILFWSGKNIVGWLLTIAGALFILAGLIANMHIYFRPTSLFN